MRRSPVPIRQLLSQRPALRQIADTLTAQKALFSLVRRHLPAELATHLSATARDGQKLTLFTDSPVWGTRMRYLKPQLLAALAGDGHKFTQLRVRLDLPKPAATRGPRNTTRRSDKGAAIIHASALDTKQPDLRAALVRLAERLKQ